MSSKSGPAPKAETNQNTPIAGANSVHVERLQTEHFLDAKPGNDLGFDESDAEQQSDYRVFEIVLPGVL